MASRSPSESARMSVSLSWNAAIFHGGENVNSLYYCIDSNRMLLSDKDLLN